MTIKTVTLHMYAKVGQYDMPGATTVYDCNFSDIPNFMKDLVYLGAQDVELDFPDIDTRQAQIEQLEKQIEAVELESRKAVNVLLDRISNLRAIGHE